jgi:outer membrane protein TolC
MADEMAVAQAALDAASKTVVELGNQRDKLIDDAKGYYEAEEARLMKARDELIAEVRSAYKAKLAAARKTETTAKNTLTDLMGKQAQVNARAKADAAFAASGAKGVTEASK